MDGVQNSFRVRMPVRLAAVPFGFKTGASRRSEHRGQLQRIRCSCGGPR
jgi:hypothetical protein